jgi:hypothetical protein
VSSFLTCNLKTAADAVFVSKRLAQPYEGVPAEAVSVRTGTAASPAESVIASASPYTGVGRE